VIQGFHKLLNQRSLRLIILYHDLIGRQTESYHVKTNVVHILHRAKKYGMMELDKFKELLSDDEVNIYQNNNQLKWYTMPLEVFTSFIFKVCNSQF